MSQVFFWMKQNRHRADSFSFMRKLEARGFHCLVCRALSEDRQDRKAVPADFDRSFLSPRQVSVVPADDDNCAFMPLDERKRMSAVPSAPKQEAVIFADDDNCAFMLPDERKQVIVITDDTETARICELRKIACIGYCPAESGENGQGESVLSGHTERGPAAEDEKGSASEENRESGYFPHVRMVWESFEDREAEELEQFRCRFYGEPVVVARTERLLIRESISEDFEAIYWMESDVAPGQECCEDRKKICFCSAAGDNRKEKKEDCIAEEIICFHEEKEKFCSYIKNVYPFYGYGYWTVELTEPGREGTVIGRCGLKDYEPGENDGYVVMKKEAGDGSQQVFPPELFCLELGYVVAKPYRRQGYAYEMCKTVQDYAFAVLHADVLVVRIHPQNKASLRLARKLGFLNLIL